MGGGWEVEEGWRAKMKESDFFFLIKLDTLLLQIQPLFLASSTARNANNQT